MFEDCVAKVSFRNENTFQEETELSLGKQQAKEEREIRSSLKLIGSRTVMSAIDESVTTLCFLHVFDVLISCESVNGAPSKLCGETNLSKVTNPRSAENFMKYVKANFKPS